MCLVNVLKIICKTSCVKLFFTPSFLFSEASFSLKCLHVDLAKLYFMTKKYEQIIANLASPYFGINERFYVDYDIFIEDYR